MKNFSLRHFTSAAERRKTLEKMLHLSFSHTGKHTFYEKDVENKNCENLIGATQIPLGVAGPLTISNINPSTSLGQKAKSYYIPLATTEGALVASVNRGCKAIIESGGAVVHSHRVGVTRGPVFFTGSIIKGEMLYSWFKKNKEDLKKVAAATSHHLKLEKFDVKTVGQYVFVRFYFDPQDAMGMNMATIATDSLVSYITKETGVTCLSLSGNFCADKKPAWQNFLNNRGIKVWAEVTLTSEVLRKVLKTSVEKMYQVWLAKCMVGSAMSGSMGYNAQFANVVAALFLATGQDMAHVGEGGIGMTTMEVIKNSSDDALYISVYLPDVMVGTVGGGTGLSTQNEALELLGVAGGNEGKNAQKLVEIVGATVLAGEISLLASLSEGSLVKAHERLGRRKG